MEKITTSKVQQSKVHGQKIIMLTAYDFPFAKILDDAGVEIILIGDSLGNVALGYRNTLPVTMPEMIIHTRAVSGAVERALLVADMPFGSFQKDPKDALFNAIKLVKAGAEGVKIEGAEYLEAIKKIIRAGIPVMGHLGFTPQSVHQLGGYAKQGKSKKSAQKILGDARALQKAGCFAIVLEMVPDDLAKRITKALKIPTIGIGAGPDCDGQVLVTSDLLGLSVWMPSFARPKANLRKAASRAVKAFIREVRG
ncbi:3-methyl-2-oxobutanoate hydroxymethyltransferase [candidate division WOR-1 bacterium DG_54_3]|uniref:3-methyl-2-oxobutanoate hydroxymethyltransferase n=1 Tax=candidate division WOR-1 bacterium DG_54_3 TaxID=1703775 RepID=A0A0S7XQG4_UNCSA|nr:MAG: 3-methyl-2-oxobutanoate hydroxymethyltransferase [candidate division WOR-1 bacterium DG_54_3]